MTTMYDERPMPPQVEDGHVPPVPPTREFYPWSTMAVGQSFYVESDDPYHMVKRLSTLTAYQRRKHGRRFTMKQEGQGVRVWRIEG